MTSLQVPERQKAWRLHDPAWVKARKAEWKHVKEKLPVVGWFLNQTDKKILKNYFMEGCGYNPERDKPDWGIVACTPENPLRGVSGRVMFEFWLHPDRSEENWKKIVSRYCANGDTGIFNDSRSRFRELIRTSLPAEGSLFDGLDERIYRMFTPVRCRRQDYPELDEAEYYEKCWTVCAQLVMAIRNFISAEKVNNESLAPALVREWCDAAPGAYMAARNGAEKLSDKKQAKKYLDYYLRDAIGWQIIKSHEIIQNPENFEPKQVDVAREILARLYRAELHEDLQEFAAPYLEAAADFALPKEEE